MKVSGPSARRGSYLLIAAVLLALILDGLDLQLLSMVGPKVIEDWQITTAAFSQALASAILGVALGAALGGWAGDHVGHRRVLLWSMVVCAVATAVTATAANILQLATIRFFTGIAIGTLSASALVYVTQTLAHRARARVGALAYTSGPAGGMLGSGIVLLIEPRYGWHGCFVVAGGAMLLAALLVGALRPPNASGEEALRDRVAEIPKPSMLFAAGNSRMNVGAPLAFTAITYMGYSFAWTPVILTKSGLPLSEAVTGYLAYNLMALLSPLVAGLIMARVGTRLIMLGFSAVGIGFAILLANVLAMHQQAPTTELKILIFAGIGGIGGTTSLLAAVMNGLIACGYDDGCRGRGVGLSMMMGRIGGLASIVIGGMLLDRADGPSTVFYVIAAGLVLVILAAFIIDRHLESTRKLDRQDA